MKVIDVADWRAAVAGSVALAVLYALLPGLPGEILFQLIAWTSVIVFIWGTAVHRRLGKAWIAIGAGWASFASGDLLFFVYNHVLDTDPFPSPADFFYLAGYPLIAGGLAALVRRSRPDGDRIALIDAGIIVVPVVVIAWLYLIEPNAVDGSGGLLARIVSASYPAGDLLCLVVVLRFVAGPVVARRNCHPSLTLLLVGLFVMLVADVSFAMADLYGVYVSGGWSDSLFVIPYVTFAAAAVHPSIAHIGDPLPSSDPSLGIRRLVLLATAALVTPVVLVVRWLFHNELAVPLIVIATAASFLLVVARMSRIVDALEHSRAKLAHDATHDPLTGLPNRTLFTRRLEEVLRERRGGALLFVDLDRFKHINDRFGHQAGDEVLVLVAERMVRTLRETDHVSRLAGDEFAVVLPGATQTKAYFVAERLLHELRFEVPLDVNEVGGVSASIGLVMWNPGDTRSATELLNEADRAMYAAKSGAGNQLATSPVTSTR